MIRRNKLLFLVISIMLTIIYFYNLRTKLLFDNQTFDFTNFNNDIGSRKLIVPNIVHFIQFDMKTLNFVTFICLLSAWYNHKPSKESHLKYVNKAISTEMKTPLFEITRVPGTLSSGL